MKLSPAVLVILSFEPLPSRVGIARWGRQQLDWRGVVVAQVPEFPVNALSTRTVEFRDEISLLIANSKAHFAFVCLTQVVGNG